MGRYRIPSIRHVEFCHVAADVRLDLCHSVLELGVSEIAVTAVDGSEFAAVDRDDGIGKQIELLFAPEYADRGGMLQRLLDTLLWRRLRSLIGILPGGEKSIPESLQLGGQLPRFIACVLPFVAI